jgi:hypothetical protein
VSTAQLAVEARRRVAAELIATWSGSATKKPATKGLVAAIGTT